MNTPFLMGTFLILAVVAFLATLKPAGSSGVTNEGFMSLIPRIMGSQEDNPADGIGPVPARLDMPRKPYHLLSDVLKDAPSDTIGCLTAGCCN